MAAGLGKWHDLTTKVFRLCQGELAPDSITNYFTTAPATTPATTSGGS